MMRPILWILLVIYLAICGADAVTEVSAPPVQEAPLTGSSIVDELELPSSHLRRFLEPPIE